MIERVLLLLYALSGVAFGLNCPDGEEYPVIEWMRMQGDYGKTLFDWKEQVERQCDLSDAQEHWQSLFKCPDFSDVTCLDEFSRYSETGENNCTFVFCANGSYVATKKALQKIYQDNVDAHKKIMEFYKNELIDCRPRVCPDVTAATDFTTTAVTPSDDIDVTTAAESTTRPVDLVSWATSGNLHYKCFKDVRHTYAEAKSICGSYGGRLATKVLRDPVAVSDLIANGCDGGSIFDGDQWVWIGFDDVNSEGTWRWSDGGNMNNVTTEWSDAEPNDEHGNEDCGSLWGSINGKLQLNDYICSEQLNYICEVENAMADCSAVDPENYKSGDENGGVFEIYSEGQNLDVYCDLRTDGGGWTVLQRRMDGSVDFYRNHSDYVNGFGNVSGEFWLGLDNLYHILQSHAQFQLRIDMEDWDGVQKYAKYSLFSIGNYSEDYQLAERDIQEQQGIHFHTTMV